MLTRTYGQYCGLAQALDVIGDRWTLLVIRELLIRPCRYSDIRDGLPGVATNLLAERLRALEAHGVVQRRTLPPPAGSTIYELTDFGRELEQPVLALTRWGGRWMVTGPGEDAVQGHWLVVALRALLPATVDPGLRTSCHLEVEGEMLHLRVDDGRVEVGMDAIPGGADATLRASAPALLAVASGLRSLEDAVAEGGIELDARATDTGAVAALLSPRA